MRNHFHSQLNAPKKIPGFASSCIDTSLLAFYTFIMIKTKEYDPFKKRGYLMRKPALLFSLACISTFNPTQTASQKIDFKDKFEFLKDEENQTLSTAIVQIKWRIKSGYLAELNNDIIAVRWLVKKLAQTFRVKTTTIATKIGTFAANEYVKFAKKYLGILKDHGAEEAKKYTYLYPEYDADLSRF